MFNTYTREACIQSLQEARIAQKLGADRLEYCSRLDLDGLSPSIGEIEQAVKVIQIPIMVMIRPREGNFEYSAREFDTMKKEIEAFKEYKIKGFVFGINKGNEIDAYRTSILANLCDPFEVCFHKAIDYTKDPIQSVQCLNEIAQIRRILTSGGASTAKEGIPILKEMMKVARNDLSIMPAGKIRASNIAELHLHLDAKEYHGRSILMHY